MSEYFNVFATLHFPHFVTLINTDTQARTQREREKKQELPTRAKMLKNFVMRPLRRFKCDDASKKHKLFQKLSANNKFSDVTKVCFKPMQEDSKWMRQFQMCYIENGQEKEHDIIKTMDSVLIILYNVSREKLIYVRQFRPAVLQREIAKNGHDIPQGCVDLQKFPPSVGITLELCAGMVDKDKSLSEIAREEVLEECGYDVPVERLERIFTYRSGVSSYCGTVTMFYCDVCDSEKASQGGGIEDEVIQVVELTIPDARDLVSKGGTVNTGPGTLLGTQWFLSNKM